MVGMEEEELKRKKLDELKQKYLEQKEAEQKEIEMESRVQALLRKTLDDKARERLSNVRLVNKELYMKAFRAIMGLAQKGYVKERLTEEQVKEILLQLKGSRETTIRRK